VVEVFARFQVDLVLHAGDVCVPSVLQELSHIALVIAVTGNNDTADLAQFCRPAELIEVGPYRIALLHGHGGRSARDEARRWVGKADLVVYGHSHVPSIERVDGTILFNPGSPTDRRWQEHFGLGLIRIDADGVAPELVLFRDPRHLRSVQPR
jgi:putative phosphoesterase